MPIIATLSRTNSNDSCRSRPASCRTLRFGAAVGMLLTLLANGAGAQLGEDEVWFDGPPYDPATTQPGSDRTAPDVAVGCNGRTVVAWQANTDGWDIWARVFEADGTAVGNPLLVNTTTTDNQTAPRVAAAPDGSFTVVWVNAFDPVRGADVYSVRSRTFDADGAALSSEQTVNELTKSPSFSGGALRPDVAALAGGSFVAVWRSATFSGSVDTNVSIQGRLLTSSGTPTGSQFLVNNVTTSGSQNYPAVDGLPAVDPDGPWDGGFVVAWTQPQLHIRRFQANGTSTENDAQVDTQDGERLDLAIDEASGQVAVTWYDASAVWVRLFDEDLSALTSVLQASAVTDTDADDPTVTDIGQDGFYLAWNSSTGSGTDNDQSSIQARILGADGSFSGDQFQINKWISNNQQSPRLGSTNGRMGAAWRSSGNPYGEPGDDHILGYILEYCGLFCDGFESGNTSRWD